MPLPTGADQHVNSLLTNMSVSWMTEPSKYIADQVFPACPVMKQTGLYAEYDRGDFLRDEAQIRTPMTKAAVGGYRVSTTSNYNCVEYAYAKGVADQDRWNADEPFKPDEDAGKWLTQKRRIKEEVVWRDSYFTTGLWTGSTTGTDLVAGTDFVAWDDPASDVIGLFDDQTAEVESNTGFTPNVLAVNRRGWNALKNHPDIVERLKGMGSPERPAIATQQNVASILELDRVVVAKAPINSAQEGVTATTDYIVGNHALLCYATSNPSLDEPSAGYIFRWTPAEGAGGAVIETYREPREKGDYHEINFAFDAKLVSGVLGVFMQNVVS